MFIETVAIPIFEELDPAGVDVAGAQAAVRVAEHLGHVHSAIFVERDRHRINDVRLASDQLDSETRRKLERALFFVRCQGSGMGFTVRCLSAARARKSICEEAQSENQ